MKPDTSPKAIMAVTLIVMLGLLFGAAGYLINYWATAPIHYISSPNDFCQSVKLEECDGKRVSIIGSVDYLSKGPIGIITDIQDGDAEYKWAGGIFLMKDGHHLYRDEGINKGSIVNVMGIIRKGGQPCSPPERPEQCLAPYHATQIEVESLKVIEERGIIISTDKTEYEVGETINIALSRSNKPIYVEFGTGYTFYQLKGDVWEKLTTSCETNCVMVCENGTLKQGPCMLYEMPLYFFGEYNGLWEIQWNQKECIYETKLCGGKNYTEGSLKQTSAGRFKVGFCYFDKEDVDLSEPPGKATPEKKKCVEREFTIKEKTSEILTIDYVLKHSKELINKSISVKGAANNNKNKVVCTKGPGCNKCDSPLILEENSQSIEISGRLINTPIICTGTDCEGIKECKPLAKGKSYIITGIWNGKSLDIESWTEKSAIDPRCSQKVKITGICEGKLIDDIGYQFNSEIGKCVEKVVGGTGCRIETPFNSLEECQKVCGKSNEKKLEFETIKKENHVYYKKIENLVIKNGKEWIDLWNLLGYSLLPSLIDFNKEMVIAVFQGEKSTGGYSIEINRITEKENEIEVSVLETSPGPGCMVTKALTSPYHIVKLAKQIKEIKFNVTEMTNNCEAYSQ